MAAIARLDFITESFTTNTPTTIASIEHQWKNAQLTLDRRRRARKLQSAFDEAIGRLGPESFDRKVNRAPRFPPK
ncbi:hypothetical protein Trydic_g19641 [Trypoxylus dichotomus]